MKRLLYSLTLSVMLLIHAASVGAFPPEDDLEIGAYKRMGLLMHASRKFVKDVGTGTAPWAEYEGLMTRSRTIQPLLTLGAWGGDFAMDTRTNEHLANTEYTDDLGSLHSYTMNMFGTFDSLMEQLNADHVVAQKYIAAITKNKAYTVSGADEITLDGTYKSFMQMHKVFFTMKAGLLKKFPPRPKK